MLRERDSSVNAPVLFVLFANDVDDFCSTWRRGTEVGRSRQESLQTTRFDGCEQGAERRNRAATFGETSSKSTADAGNGEEK